MFADVRGARLWFDVLSPEVTVSGDEVVVRPTVIGVHGGPGIDSTSLVGVLAPLAAVAQTIRFDQRGHGRSEHGQEADWTVESWADDLADFIDGLGLQRPLLLGTSFGARVALTYAVRHPAVVSGVICAYGGARLDEYETVQAFGRLGGEHAARVAAGDPADPEAGFQEWLGVCWPLVSRTPEGRQHLQRMQELSTHSHDVHAVHAAKNLEARPLPHLDQVTCPVLVISGREDPLSTPTVMTELAAGLTASPRVQLTLIPDAGHALFADQPNAAYSTVADFIYRTTASPG